MSSPTNPDAAPPDDAPRRSPADDDQGSESGEASSPEHEPGAGDGDGAAASAAAVKTEDTSAHQAETEAEAESSAPPLPNEPIPDQQQQQQDDGWTCQWDPTHQRWYFFNRFTQQTQWENPRVPPKDDTPNPTSNPTTTTSTNPAAPSTEAQPTSAPLPTDRPAAGGYNPAIHGDYDPNAWYAQTHDPDDLPPDPSQTQTAAAGAEYASATTATFNRWTGQFQTAEMGPDRHTDEAKSRRQMNAFFDVDAAANAHDGRSLRAERQMKKPTKAELKAYKDKRKAKKDEKRRAWLLN